MIVQSPNFFGIAGTGGELAAIVAEQGRAAGGGLYRSGVARVDWSRRARPILWSGELQCFAISPSYGGPVRGHHRDAGESTFGRCPAGWSARPTDRDGNRAFCLTLATREQHIRREKATSNICTNQALIALMATVFMTVYGKEGLRELAEQNLAKAHYLAGKLQLAFRGAVLQRICGAARMADRRSRSTSACWRRRSSAACRWSGSIRNLKDSMLLCATEMNKRAGHGSR